jgi:polyphosphate kinase
MNSLVDDDVIKALYQASQAGVKVDLIVRGICCLKPGIEGVSDNIRVVSIVGKYLEHPRMFYFKNDASQVYISSADWMPRNLMRRIELLTTIKNEAAKEKIIQILKLQVGDNTLSHELHSDGNYVKVAAGDAKAINNQKLMEEFVDKVSKATKKESPSSVQQLAARLFVES